MMHMIKMEKENLKKKYCGKKRFVYLSNVNLEINFILKYKRKKKHFTRMFKINAQDLSFLISYLRTLIGGVF